VVVLNKHHIVWRKGFIIPEDGGIMFQNIGTSPPSTWCHFPKTVSSEHNSELLLVTLIQFLSVSSSVTKQVTHYSVQNNKKNVKLIIKSVKQRLSSMSIISNCFMQWCSYIFWHPRLVNTMATNNTNCELQKKIKTICQISFCLAQ